MRTLNLVGCGRVGKTLAHLWHQQQAVAQWNADAGAAYRVLSKLATRLAHDHRLRRAC